VSAAPVRIILVGLAAVASLLVVSTLAAPAAFARFRTSRKLRASDASHVVVTPAQARAVVTAWNQAANTAAANFDPGTLDQVEAMPLLGIDAPSFQNARASGSTPPPVIGIANLMIYVPKQNSYPAQFLARLDDTTGTNFFLFVKPSKQGEWKAAYQAKLGANAPAPDLALDRRGFATLIPDRQAKKQLKFDPDTLGQSYSNFLNQSAAASAPAPSVIFSPDVAKEMLSSLPPVSSGQRVVTHTPANYPVYSYRTRDGGAFSIISVNVDIQTTAGAGAVLAPSQQLFELRPGQRYQSEDVKGIDLVALSVPPASASALATSPADYNAVISATGAPA